MGTLDLTHLRYFQVIARHQSLTAAARALRVSQPTLTNAVRGLEEHLQTTLLYRNRDGVSLTAAGQKLLVHATELFAQVERCEQELRGLESDEVGSFVLGCHESLGAYFLPGFMGEFLRRAPRIELTLWNGTSESVRQAVLSRDVHVGLIVNPIPHPDLVLVPLFHDAVDVFVHAEPAGGAGDGAEGPEDAGAALERLRAGPVIFAGRVEQCRQILQALGENGVSTGRLLSCGDLELVKSLTLAGIGVGILPRRVAAYGQEGRLRRLHPSLPFVPDVISLAYRADAHRTRAMLALKDALVAYGKRLDDGRSPPG